MSDFDNNNNKYNDLGREVRDSIFEAINSGDISGLSSSVSKTIATALDDVGDALNVAANGGLSDAQKHYREQMAKAQEVAKRYHEEQEERLRRNKEMRGQQVRKPNQSGATASDTTISHSSTSIVSASKFRPVGMIKGPLKILAGGWGLLITLFLFFGSILADEILFGTIFTLIFGGITGLIFASGLTNLIQLRKARNINRILGGREYCQVSELATETGISPEKLIKELKSILNKGFFREGFLDKEGKTFMNSRKVYDEYLKASKYRAEHPEESVEATKSTTPTEETITTSTGAKLSVEQQQELWVMMTDGQNAIKRLHDLNDDIPGEAITAKLYTTEGLLNDIFNRVKEHPEQMKKCHKLMDYHLPTMLKLVEAYAEYDKVTVPGPDIIKAKEEIEKTMDVINQAFIELLNRMFQDSVWDVTADAQVLKSMLTQEGLAKDIVIEQ